MTQAPTPGPLSGDDVNRECKACGAFKPDFSAACTFCGLAPTAPVEASGSERLWPVGSWLSAALDDPKVCEAMKSDIRDWFDNGGHLRPQPSGETREAVARLASLADDAEAMSLDIAMSNYVGTGAYLASDLRAILALLSARPLTLGGQQGEDAAWSWLNRHVECDPADRDYSADEMVDAFMAGAGRYDIWLKALERIAGEHQHRSGYCQTDITVEPALTAEEAQTVARDALSTTPARAEALSEDDARRRLIQRIEQWDGETEYDAEDIASLADDILHEFNGAPEIARAEAQDEGAATDDLVDRFAVALKARLRAAGEKYGFDDAWKADDWRNKLIEDLLRHIQKGDPRDVAAYCAFAWHHDWSLSPKQDDLRSAAFTDRGAEDRYVSQDEGAAGEPEWVVNDIAELGVKIGERFYWLYKGQSLVYGQHGDDVKGGVVQHEDGGNMHWRPVFKREFGECCHPVNYADPTRIGTVSLDDSDDWKPLPAAHPSPTPAADADRVRIAVETLEATRNRVQEWPIGDYETCMCGSPVASHGMGDGHSPVSQGDHAISMIVEAINEALAALKSTAAKEGSNNVK